MKGHKDDTDTALLLALKEGNKEAFDMLYTKYAAMMYGCILEICEEERLASKIFKRIFLNLKNVHQSKPLHTPFAFWLWQHTGTETYKIMSNRQSIKKGVEDMGIIKYLCFNRADRNEAAVFFNINDSDLGLRVKKDLQISN